MLYIIQSNDDFNEKLKEAGSKLVVVNFFANWDSACRLISPSLRVLANTYGKDAVLLKINVDRLTDLCTFYDVTVVPTYIFLRNKCNINTAEGPTLKELEALIKKMICQP